MLQQRNNFSYKIKNIYINYTIAIVETNLMTKFENNEKLNKRRTVQKYN